ncbi:hypothetical protein E2C01_017971 [Portunus trituberculatus]|uniref:Transmembrane protein n=1 Tax=Portunus trituberculatus TaxID=210409 RepID=A0A5B7DUY7_PORTR|nr:hypothetical protein [Portunus trituberculatus]
MDKMTSSAAAKASQDALNFILWSVLHSSYLSDDHFTPNIGWGNLLLWVVVSTGASVAGLLVGFMRGVSDTNLPFTSLSVSGREELLEPDLTESESGAFSIMWSKEIPSSNFSNPNIFHYLEEPLLDDLVVVVGVVVVGSGVVVVVGLTTSGLKMRGKGVVVLRCCDRDGLVLVSTILGTGEGRGGVAVVLAGANSSSMNSGVVGSVSSSPMGSGVVLGASVVVGVVGVVSAGAGVVLGGRDVVVGTVEVVVGVVVV